MAVMLLFIVCYFVNCLFTPDRDRLHGDVPAFRSAKRLKQQLEKALKVYQLQQQTFTSLTLSAPHSRYT